MSSHVIVLPLTQKTHDEVASELLGQNLGKEVNVGDEGRLQNDRDVGGVEKLDWIRLLVSSHLPGGQTQFDSETLYTLS